MQVFNTLILSWRSIFQVFRTFSIEMNVGFCNANSTSYILLSSSILCEQATHIDELLTWLKSFPCIVMLQAGIIVDLENTMVKDFVQCKCKPLILLSCTTMSISCCSSVFVSAMTTVSYVLMLELSVYCHLVRCHAPIYSHITPFVASV